MKYIILTILVVMSCSLNAEETRCGWLNNPTSANIWLIDRDGSWDISIQGGASLDDQSLDKVYEALKNQDDFVRTNRNYGFSCACLVVDVNSKTNSIVKVYAANQQTLKTCLEDVTIAESIPLLSK